MHGLNTFRATCTRTDIHPLTKKTASLEGEIAWRKPNLARIDLYLADEAGKKDQDKSQMERYIADGKFIWEYNQKDKAIIAHEMPKDGAADNILLAITRGMKADDLKKRFEIQLVKSDDHYAYLRLRPKNDADRQDYSAVDLAVFIKNPNPEGKSNLTHTIAQIRLSQPNGRVVAYRFGDMQLNLRLDDSVFKAQAIPGFEVKRAATEPTPPSKESAQQRRN